jgi:hypothetical protein
VTKCSKQDCTANGIWIPVLKCTPDKKNFLTAKIRLPLCDDHKAATTINDLVSNEGWKQICQVAINAGRKPPRREYTTIEWERLP